ncbi:MAG: Membrane-integrating protein Mistic [Phormidesmis priestleyi Ana]|uniref:Membrane-integrating protein Mistic n=1 Tax=Phormidesmis priestleyi Ana TaxID=1666911 RepID=A0A0P8A1P5_9CYAN|nr:MAG: Membrane-integrating protein Mistic [Phormidesmis priestleyi Ana]
MGRRKKTSPTLLKAQKRLAGLRSIGIKLDLGNGITTASFEKEVTDLSQAILKYNELLGAVDDAANSIEQAEQNLSISSENVLMSVKIKYGKDSSQYEVVGGTRLRDRRRRRPSSTETRPAASATLESAIA